ncbi:SCO3242 family prenyltransferase [Cellulosimicrobium cellulans]|uniref:4-hydroxybenzoate polyprenyltransferase n=1 Tax=Cellulosimicrobium funkei TaxID=264251 RepID=A0A0H2KTP5_9MICO|nr:MULTISPECIES: UbiA family prenyltransferase [Cellulosimicrobium]KLN35229.1 4-hydroxybenzoate polyprenyltransferase [Cellulosimicrobium funkei]
MTGSLHDHLDLVRAPAVLSVVGDTLAGAAAAGHAFTPRRALLPLASACLYAGGMALNDYADRDLDAVERPERPIPSGRISEGRALRVAVGLTAAGVGLAAAGGGARALAVAVPLAASVWTYDTVAKEHAVGPVVMAACRGLDVLLGAGVGHLRAALPAAAGMAVHTAGVTFVSRGEVHGTTSSLAAGVAAATAVGGAVVGVGALRRGRGAGPGRATRVASAVAGVVAAGAYLATALPRQVDAAITPSAGNAFAATKAGIRAMLPLQAAWAARGGSLASVGVLAGVEVAGRLLRRAGRGRAEMSET